MSDYAHVDQHYVPHVEHARREARAHPSLRALLSDALDPAAQLGFLIEFCALGVRMLRPVEAALRHGAVICSEAGFDSLGADLTRLGKDAASRRLLIIDDLVQLASGWHDRFGHSLDLGALVRRPPPTAALRHAALPTSAGGPQLPELWLCQARTANAQAGGEAADGLPFSLLGIELELGELAIDVGPCLIRACERKLGSAILPRLSYLQARTEHAALRADDLLERLDDLLRAIPELGELIAAPGREALRVHLQMLAACVTRGQRLVFAHTARLAATS